MANGQSPPLTLNQALEALAKLQAVAPTGTAGTLEQVINLLQYLSDENAYLSTLVMESGIPSVPVPKAAPFPESAPIQPVNARRTVTSILRELKTEAETDPTAALLTGLSEALRPPLVAIRGRSELVRGGLSGKISTEQDQWLAAIQENTERAFAVLDAVQEMVRLRKGQVKINWLNFISTDLLTEAWGRIRDRARLFNHEITIHAPDTVPLARGDFYQTLIILTDMLDNAVRYTPPGGQIRMSVDSLGTHVLFTVVDNGIGLTPDDLEKVGRPFWRGDHHRLVRQHPGTGLRLYLAKEWLSLQDGEMIFSGEPGVGSTFSFTLRTPD
jgi:signal transduction histidine kinase